MGARDHRGLSGDGFDAGYCVEPDVLDAAACERLSAVVTDAHDCAGSRRGLDIPAIRQTALTLRQHARIASRLAPDSVAVQCISFNKSANANWSVGLHQDTIFPLRERVASASFRRWSSKEGIAYAQLPLEVLQAMLAVRVHLDASDAGNGPLRVVPHTHRHGLLDDAAVAACGAAVQCLAARGAALLMRPLLLHASAKAVNAAPRRVLHFVFAPRALPGGARWHYEV